MAIWQYTFHVLHQDNNNALNRSKELFDDELFWKQHPFKRTFFEKIDSILKKNKSWSDAIDLYGNLESNCFEIIFDPSSDNVLSVSFRIDFRSDYKNILTNIIKFCSENKLIVLDENLHNIDLKYERINNIIQVSAAHKKYCDLLNH